MGREAGSLKPQSRREFETAPTIRVDLEKLRAEALKPPSLEVKQKHALDLDDETEEMPENRTAAQKAEDERWEALQRMRPGPKAQEESGLRRVEDAGRAPTAEQVLMELLGEHKNQVWIAGKMLQDPRLAKKPGEEPSTRHADYADLESKQKKSQAMIGLIEGLLAHLRQKKPLTAEEKAYLEERIEDFTAWMKEAESGMREETSGGMRQALLKKGEMEAMEELAFKPTSEFEKDEQSSWGDSFEHYERRAKALTKLLKAQEKAA